MVKKLEYPFTEEKVRQLRVGDAVAVSGPVFSGRDRLHKYLAAGGKCPVDLRNAALYHCGPVALRRDGVWVVRAAGPTTSMRQEPYAAAIVTKHHVRVIMGKGGMGARTRKVCAEHGTVYLQAVGGAAAVCAACVERVEAVHFLREFGAAEAMWELVVRDFPAVVTMDATGRSLHKRVAAASKRTLRQLLADGQPG